MQTTKVSGWLLLVPFFLIGLFSHQLLFAHSQDEIMLYEKVSDDGEYAIWSLVAVFHAPNAPNEPEQPGDFLIPVGSGGGGALRPGNPYLL